MGGPILGANGKHGTKNFGSLAKRIRLEQRLSPGDIATQTWKLLDSASLPCVPFSAKSGKKKKAKEDQGFFKAPLADVLASNANHLAALEARLAGSSGIERERLIELQALYCLTFGYMDGLASQLTSECGFHRTISVKYGATVSKFRGRLKKPGVAGFLEKHALSAIGGLSFYSALEGSGAIEAAASLLSRLLHGIDPEAVAWVTRAAGAIVSFGAAFAAKAGASRLLSAASEKRGNRIREAAFKELARLGADLHEVKKAIVELVVLEYQRLATQRAISIGVAPESETLIERKMVQVVLNMREKHGIDLRLPLDVEHAQWNLLYPKRQPSRLKKEGEMLRTRMKTLLWKWETALPSPAWENSREGFPGFDVCGLCVVA